MDGAYLFASVRKDRRLWLLAHHSQYRRCVRIERSRARCPSAFTMALTMAFAIIVPMVLVCGLSLRWARGPPDLLLALQGAEAPVHALCEASCTVLGNAAIADTRWRMMPSAYARYGSAVLRKDSTRASIVECGDAKDDVADQGPPRLVAGLRRLSVYGRCLQPQIHGVIRDDIQPGNRTAPVSAAVVAADVLQSNRNGPDRVQVSAEHLYFRATQG